MPVLLLLVGLCAMLLPTRSNSPIIPLLPPPHCLEYGGCKHYPPPHRPHHHHHPPPQNPFVPAPPGKTPACAKHGETFCEKPERYPMHLIRYLVDHWVYDYGTLLSDESRGESPRPKPVYGPPPLHYGPYPPPLYPPAHPLSGNSINFTQPEGYPERSYPLSSLPILSDDPGLIYSAILQPGLTPYDPSDWWKRYARSERSTRSKRQAPGQDIQLCPTRSAFITPRAALNSQGNWMFVVNLEQDQNSLTQQVRSETCVSNQCNGICTLPNGYTSRCQQQFVQKRLIALQGSGSQLYTDTFWLPHCCICQITLTNNGG